MERIGLLIVDDHRLFRQGLASLLASEPSFEVVGMAASGREALELLTQVQPDVAVIDLRMPDMPGVQVIAQLLARRPSLGIVVLTASEDNADLVAAIQAGARGYVLKNADADSLIEVIGRVHSGSAALCDHATPKAMEILRAMQARPLYQAALTPREQEVVSLIVDGADNGEIANRLVISENTVKTHVSHILEKLDMRNRSDLIAWGSERSFGLNRVLPEKPS